MRSISLLGVILLYANTRIETENKLFSRLMRISIKNIALINIQYTCNIIQNNYIYLNIDEWKTWRTYDMFIHQQVEFLENMLMHIFFPRNTLDNCFSWKYFWPSDLQGFPIKKPHCWTILKVDIFIIHIIALSIY